MLQRKSLKRRKKDAAADSSDNPPKPETKPGDAESGPRRYLLVKVDFDETLLGKKTNRTRRTGEARDSQ
jgi:hypothetical protein